MDITYEQVVCLKSLSSDIIAKECTIKDINKMIKVLTKDVKDTPGNRSMRACLIEVGNQRLGLSEREVSKVLELLLEARDHLVDTIANKKKELKQILSKDPDGGAAEKN